VGVRGRAMIPCMENPPTPAPIPFELEHPGSFSGRIVGRIQVPEGEGPFPAVLVCHGFKGFLDWGFFPPLADLLVNRGFAVARFNYSGSGMQPGDELVTDEDAFRRNTFSLELSETLHVLDALPTLLEDPPAGDAPASSSAPSRASGAKIDPERLALLGHSRGGGAAILAAAHPAWKERVRALVTWSAVATFDRYGKDHREAWRRDGVLPIENARTGQKLALGIELLRDVEENSELLDLERAASELRAPWLIVHGAADETVPIDEARTLARQATAEHQLVEVPAGPPTFGARHPFTSPTPALIQAMNATQTWLLRHLR
ncbi:MAG: alpha/beta fold hydrolase, partial [Holophagales bacterium]|nr:alpha/beta fold hydrolase [Holophagales bacterium]